MKEERMTFKVTNDEGQEVECEALFTFESDETNKHYIQTIQQMKKEILKFMLLFLTRKKRIQL